MLNTVRHCIWVIHSLGYCPETFPFNASKQSAHHRLRFINQELFKDSFKTYDHRRIRVCIGTFILNSEFHGEFAGFRMTELPLEIISTPDLFEPINQICFVILGRYVVCFVRLLNFKGLISRPNHNLTCRDRQLFFDKSDKLELVFSYR